MITGTNIIFHGGWQNDGVICLQCGFPCSYQMNGVITGYHQQWDYQKKQMVETELLSAELKNGANVYGYAEQFLLCEADSVVDKFTDILFGATGSMTEEQREANLVAIEKIAENIRQRKLPSSI